MSWEELIKAPRDRKGKTERDGKITERTGVGRFKPIKQTRIAGGNPIADLKQKEPKGDLDSVFDEEMEELAEMTRSDLMDMVMEKIGEMSKDELIELLTKTQGNLKEATV